MRVTYTLEMKNPRIRGVVFQEIRIVWEGDISSSELLQQSTKWITSRNFLTDRMEDLDEVGESSLTIEPIEET